MGQADRLEQSLAQSVEQRRPLGRVQVDQPVDPRQGHRRGVEVAPAGRQTQPCRFDQRRPAADEGVEYDAVARGVGRQQPFDELRRELPGPGEGIGPHPFGDVEGALGKGRPVQGRGGEGVVQDHGRNELDAERVRDGAVLPQEGISVWRLASPRSTRPGRAPRPGSWARNISFCSTQRTVRRSAGHALRW